MKKKLSGLAIAAALLCGACYGPNKTWNSLHEWNGTATENRWGNEAIFIGLNIIPVYPICYLADIIVFNSIEWWKSDGE